MSRRRNITSAPTGGHDRAEPAATTPLSAARRILVTGLADASLATVQVACDIAEALGAAICPGGADVASPLGPIVIRAGGVTAEPAELRDRADLVVAWFCDPDSRWPDFASEFLARGPGGLRPRQVLAVGPEPVAGASRHVPLPAGAAVDAARVLQALLLGHEPPPGNPAAAMVAAACGELLTAIRAADCVAFLTCRDGDPTGLATWATSLLVRQLAHERPAFAVPLRGSATAGEPATTVMTWRYGAAGAIACADRLGGDFRPGECSAAALIARGEVDAVLVVGDVTPEVEAAIAARASRLAVVRIAATDVGSLTTLRHALQEPGDPRAVR